LGYCDASELNCAGCDMEGGYCCCQQNIA
jgi:hypothetical protein